MPKMGNIGVSNASAFGFTTSIGKGFFISIVGNNTGGPITLPNTVKVDSSGYIYVCASDNTGTYKASYVVKLTPTGSFLYSKKLSASTITTPMYSMDLDSAGNIYVAGQYTATSGGYYKFDNSCTTILASSAISLTSAYAQCVAVDNSGNIFVSGNYTAGTAPTSRIFVVKYNSSGSITAQVGLKAGVTTYSGAIPQNCTINKNTGDFYMVSRMTNANSQNIYIQNKLNSGLTTLNSLGLVYLSSTSSTYGAQVGGMDYDSSGNIYMTGTTTPASNSYRYTWVTKYDSTMTTRAWLNFYRGTSGYPQNQFTQVRVDRTTDEIYAVGYVRDGGVSYSKGYISKYNSSGTVLWSRYFYASIAGDYTIYDITFDGNAYIICGQTNVTNTPMVIARLPKDGSKLGTYTVGGFTFVYEDNAPLTTTQTMQELSYSSEALASTATSLAAVTSANWSPGVSATTVIT